MVLRSIAILAFAGADVVALTASAAAQDIQPAGVGDESGVAGGEIVVTAQRRAELLENVPMAIVAVSADTLEKANITNVHELGQITPGVQIQYAGVNTQPAIRGVTSLTNGFGNENNVAIYVDGFYVSDNLSINSDLANLANIQILKGPQGTLYGRNATGGAILITTLDTTDSWTGKLSGSFARFNEVKASGYVSGPLAQGLGLSLAGSFRNSDGNIRLSDPNNNQVGTGPAAKQRQRSVRAKLVGELSDNFKATLAYNYGYSSDPTGVVFTTFEHAPPVVPANARAGHFGLASYNYDPIGRAETHQATLKLELDTGIGKLTSYTGRDWRSAATGFDFDGSYVDTGYSFGKFKERVFQQSVDYAIDAIDKVDLIVGGMYYDNRITQPGGSGAYGPGRTLTTSTFRPLTTKAWAIYGDATIHVTDALSLGVGGRYSDDHRYVTQYRMNAAGTITQAAYSKEATFSDFTPRVTIRYQLAPRTNVYASYSKGFRSGTFNASAAATPAADIPVKPEEINAYEIGFKTAGSKVRFDIAGYLYNYRNQHVSLTIPDPSCAGQVGCQVVALTGNAPSSKIYGIDAQLNFTPIERFNVTLGAAWIHGRFGNFPNAIGTGLNIVTDRNVPSQVQNWTDHQLPRAPNFSGSLSADYTAEVAGGKLVLAGNVSYTDSYVISNPSLFGPTAGAALANRQRFRQKAYALANASIDWTDASGAYTIGIFGKNLTNTNYRLTYNGLTLGDYSAKALPISYGVRVGYNF